VYNSAHGKDIEEVIMKGKYENEKIIIGGSFNIKDRRIRRRGGKLEYCKTK